MVVRLLMIFLILLPINNVFAWTIYDGAEGTTEELKNWEGHKTTDWSNSGASSFKWDLTYTGIDDGGGLSQRNFDIPTDLGIGDEFWYRAVFYVPLGFDWNSALSTNWSVAKLMRLRNDQGGYFSVEENWNGFGGCSDFAAGYISGASESMPGDPLLNCQGENLPANLLTPGNAHTLEFYMAIGSGDSSTIRIWHNGELIIEYLNAATMTFSAGGAGGNEHHLGGWYNNGAPQDQTLYVDDFMITNDRPNNQDADGNYMIAPTDWASTPVDGECNIATWGQTYVDTCPSVNLCTAGTAGTVTSDSDSCDSTCVGFDGGSTAVCTAAYSVTPVSGNTVWPFKSSVGTVWQAAE